MTINRAEGRIRLRQDEGGSLAKLSTSDFVFSNQRADDLEVIFDLFEFQIWVNDQLVLSAPNRLSEIPGGGWSIRTPRGSLELTDVVSECTGNST